MVAVDKGGMEKQPALHAPAIVADIQRVLAIQHLTFCTEAAMELLGRYWHARACGYPPATITTQCVHPQLRKKTGEAKPWRGNGSKTALRRMYAAAHNVLTTNESLFGICPSVMAVLVAGT